VTGGLIALVLLAVTCLLGFQLLKGTTADATAVPPVVAVASTNQPSGAGTKPIVVATSTDRQLDMRGLSSTGSTTGSGGEPKDAVANAMTAVATAIAAVTLILSLGTTWFGQRLKEISELQAKVDAKLREVEGQRNKYAEEFEKFKLASNQQMRARHLLLGAQLALREWIDEESRSPDRYSLFIKLNNSLETLMASAAERRMEAFRILITHLPDRTTKALSPIEEYSDVCHVLHGGTTSTIGTWTRVFHAVERQHFATTNSSSGYF